MYSLLDGGDSDEGEDEGGDEVKIMTSAEVNEVEENEDSSETMPGATEISVTASNNGHTGTPLIQYAEGGAHGAARGCSGLLGAAQG